MARRTSVIQVMITGDSRDLQRATNQGVSGFKVLGGAALAASKVIASAASAIAGFSIREFAKFDDAMTRSTAIMGEMSDTMRTEMERTAREVAKSTTFTAEQTAESFFFLASAGLDAQQSIAALPQVAAFAQAGAFDMARATDLLTDAQSALGMTVEDTTENLANMARVSDVLIRANTLANATAEQFSEALTNKAGAALRVLGKDVEEGAAVLAFYADQGVKGATAGEALNIVLRDVTRAAASNADEFAELGLSVLDSEGNLRNMADVVAEFTRVLGPMSDAQAAVTMDNLGLTRSVGNNIRQLLGGADAIREYEAALREAGGATDEVAQKQLQSFNSQLDLLGSAFADVGITIGEALAGPLSGFVAWFREQIPAIEAFVAEAIPAVERFVQRAGEKFREFKTLFDENLREPLTEFKNTIVGFGAIGREEFDELLERFRSFAPDFRAALDEGDPEEAGRLLGEFIAETFRQAFERAEIVGTVITDWAKAQDWRQIGITIGGFSIDFFEGFFIGLFSDPNAGADALESESKTITQRLKDSFVSTVIGAAILARVPLIGGLFRPLLAPFRIVFARIGTAIAARITPVLGSVILGALTSTLGMIGRALWTGVQLALLPLAMGMRAAITNLPRMLAPVWQPLLIAIRGAFRAWAFKFTGVAGATISQAIRLIAVAGIKALGKAVVAFAVAIAGWPAVLIAAIVAALAVFLIRFKSWFDQQDQEFENIGAAMVEFLFQGIRKLDTWFKDNVISWFSDRYWEFAYWFADQVITVREWGAGIVEGMVEGIKSQASALKDALVNAARDAWDATKRFLGISSPSKLFEGIGSDMMAGMSKGISESAGIIQASVGVNSAMAANEARRFAELAAQQRAQAVSAPVSGAPTNINVTVTSADPEAVVEALRRYTRANGPLNQVVSIGQIAAV